MFQNNLLQFQTPITCGRFQETPSEDLIPVNDENTQHTFFHNYSFSPYIHAVRVVGEKLFPII